MITLHSPYTLTVCVCVCFLFAKTLNFLSKITPVLQIKKKQPVEQANLWIVFS